MHLIVTHSKRMEDPMAKPAKVHRFQASLFPVNAYIVETSEAAIVIDATLGVSDGRAIAGQVRAIGKPLAGVIVTHTHPDHYGGLAALVEGSQVPIYSLAGVRDIIRRDDVDKEKILRPMFGDEWAMQRTFPNRIANEGELMSIADAAFRVIDAGPCESPYDSWWVLEGDGPLTAFVGDLAYSHMHCYLADGYHESWLKNIARARRELPEDVRLMIGHGEPSVGHGLLEWQAEYITRVLEAVQTAVVRDGLDDDALPDAVASRMQAFLANEDLLFLTRLSVPTLRRQLFPQTN
jgi:glyoxylase-like metal-dependent hydrolase (beta-lactamase superfamily II)